MTEDLRTPTAILRQLDAVIEDCSRLDDDGWRNPTRCPPWDVRRLAAHIAIPAQALTSGLSALRQGSANSIGGQPLADDTPADAVLQALRKRRRDLAAALETLTTDEMDAPLPPPEGGGLSLPTRALLQLALVEVGIHRSDLAGALGKSDTLDNDVVEAVAAVVPMWLIFGAADDTPQQAVRYDFVGDSVRLGFTFLPGTGWGFDGDAPARCEAVAPDSAIALFLMGRGDLPESATVSGDAALIGSFKRWLPGP